MKKLVSLFMLCGVFLGAFDAFGVSESAVKSGVINKPATKSPVQTTTKPIVQAPANPVVITPNPPVSDSVILTINGQPASPAIASVINQIQNTDETYSVFSGFGYVEGDFVRVLTQSQKRDLTLLEQYVVQLYFTVLYYHTLTLKSVYAKSSESRVYEALLFSPSPFITTEMLAELNNMSVADIAKELGDKTLASYLQIFIQQGTTLFDETGFYDVIHKMPSSFYSYNPSNPSLLGWFVNDIFFLLLYLNGLMNSVLSALPQPSSPGQLVLGYDYNLLEYQCLIDNGIAFSPWQTSIQPFSYFPYVYTTLTMRSSTVAFVKLLDEVVVELLKQPSSNVFVYQEADSAAATESALAAIREKITIKNFYESLVILGLDMKKPTKQAGSDLNMSNAVLWNASFLNETLYMAAFYLQSENNFFKTNHFLMGLYMAALTYNDVAFKAATEMDSLKKDKYTILLQFPYLLSKDEFDGAQALIKDTFGEDNPYAKQLQEIANILYQECSLGSFNGRISKKNRGQFLSLMDNLPNPGGSEVNANALYFIASIYQAMEQTLEAASFANTVDQSCLPYQKVYEFMFKNSVSWVGADTIFQNITKAFPTYLEWMIKIGNEAVQKIEFFSDAWLKTVLQPSQSIALPNALAWYADATFKPKSAQVNACLATIQSLVQQDVGLSTTDLYQLQKNVFIVQSAKLADQTLSIDQLTVYYAGLLRLGVEFAFCDPNHIMLSLLNGMPLSNPLSSSFTNQALINYIQNASAWVVNQSGEPLPLSQSYLATSSLSVKNFSASERVIAKSIGYQAKTSTTPTDPTYNFPFCSPKDMATLEKALYQVVIDNQGMFFVGPNGMVNYADNDHWMLYSFGMVRLGLQGFNKINTAVCKVGVPNEWMDTSQGSTAQSNSGQYSQPMPYFSVIQLITLPKAVTLPNWQSQFWSQISSFLN